MWILTFVNKVSFFITHKQSMVRCCEGAPQPETVANVF